MAHGKRFRAQYDKIDRDHAYPPAEAIALIKETASAKFDETVELHILLGVNVRHADEQLRGTLALPHGLGKDVTVAVFAQGQQARDAEAAGADFVGDDDLAKQVYEYAQQNFAIDGRLIAIDQNDSSHPTPSQMLDQFTPQPADANHSYGGRMQRFQPRDRTRHLT